MGRDQDPKSAGEVCELFVCPYPRGSVVPVLLEISHHLCFYPVSLLHSFGDSNQYWKKKGNSAFTSGDYDDAIDAYTRAIKFVQDNDSFYACRSLAYLKVDRYEDALDDANYCIRLKSDSPLGYLRKASAYRAMREYSKAIEVYRDGLYIFPREPRLQKGLAAAKRSKAKRGRASKAVRKTEVVRRASRDSFVKQTKVKKASSVSSYVKEARGELQAKMTEIQSQLELLDDLETMNDEEKLELLFGVVDVDGHGITARELATALRKHNEKLTFQDSIEHAILMVAKFDKTGDARLDMDQFKACIQVLLKDLDVSLAEFTEFLVIRMVLSIDAETVDTTNEDSTGEIGFLPKAEQQEDFTAMLTDKRILELFALFDTDNSGELSFGEVAMGLFQLTRNLEDSTKTAMQVLLALDEDDSRTLNCEEFTRLIMAIVATSGSSFHDVADGMVELLVMKEATISEEEIATLMLANAIFETASEDKGSAEKQKNIMDSLSYGRLRRLFDVLDVDKNGSISTEELLAGIQGLHDATGIVKGDSKQDVKKLLEFDKNGDNHLQPGEFAEAMTFYARKLRIDVNDLINYMCVSCVAVDDRGTRESFRKAFGKSVGSDKAICSLFGSGNSEIDFW